MEIKLSCLVNIIQIIQNLSQTLCFNAKIFLSSIEYVRVAMYISPFVLSGFFCPLVELISEVWSLFHNNPLYEMC